MATASLNSRQQRLSWLLEIGFWLFTALLTLLVVLPVLRSFVNYHYLWSNIAFVVCFVTFTRYIFLLRFTPFAHNIIVKIALAVLVIPTILHNATNISKFQTFLDNNGLAAFDSYIRPDLGFVEREQLVNYLKDEMIFFGVGAVIAGALLPVRMLISVWRTYNRGTV